MLKSLAMTALHGCGASAVMRWLRRGDLTIITYHGVVDDSRWRPWPTGDMVPLSVFRRQLDFVCKHYNVVDLRRAPAMLAAKAARMKGALAITFDDGYGNNFTHALGALRERSCRATFFVTTGFLDGLEELWWLPLKRAIVAAQANRRRLELPHAGEMEAFDDASALCFYRRTCAALKLLPSRQRRQEVLRLTSLAGQSPNSDDDVYRPLTWDQARLMRDSGMEIAAHGVSHAILTRQTPAQASEEIRKSVERVRQEVGEEHVAFGYPNGMRGDFNPQIVQMVRQAGCYAAVAGFAGRNASPDLLYELRRVPVDAGHVGASLGLTVSGVNAALKRLTVAENQRVRDMRNR